MYAKEAVPSLRLMLDKSAGAEFGKGSAQLLIGIHNDRPAPGDRFIERLSMHQEKSQFTLSGTNLDGIAFAGKYSKMTGFQFVFAVRGKMAAAGVDIGKGAVPRRDRQFEGGAGPRGKSRNSRHRPSGRASALACPPEPR